MTNMDRKIAFLLATSPYLDTVDGEYDEAAMDLTANGVTIQKWISVKERLPKYGERVLITEGHGVFEAALSVSHKWVRCGVGWTEGVTHWMLLPEPPKEDAE